MRTNESGLRRIARRSATLVKLQVRKRQKPAHPRPARPAGPLSDSWAGASTAIRRSGWSRPGLIAVLLIEGGAERVPLVVSADGGRDDRRLDRRLSGAQGANQGSRSRASTAGGWMTSSTFSTTRFFRCS